MLLRCAVAVCLAASLAAPARAQVKSLKQAQSEAKAKGSGSAAATDLPVETGVELAPPKRAAVLPGAAAPAPAEAPVAKSEAPAAAVAVAAPPAAAATTKDVEALLADAAAAEKGEQCEVAYSKYNSAMDKAGRLADKARGAELESIADNKLEKLKECYSACQPSGRQRSLFESAQAAKERGETKRAVQISRKLLTGKNQKCLFWGDVKQFLAGLPNQAEELANDKVDPCEVTPDVQKALDSAKADAKRQSARLAELFADKSKLTKNLDELIELYRSLDGTRQKVFEMREEFLDCDAVYRPLVEDAGKLREVYEQSQGAIISTYKGQLDGLAKKLRNAAGVIADKNKLLETRASEQERLKGQFDELGKFNEELYNDLFNLAGSEAISFSTQVEGRRIEKPMEEIRALIENEGKVIATLESKYPEFFKDGTNVDGLKRKKLVLEKIGQMLTKFGKAKGETHPSNARALAEVEATVKMLDKAIAAKEGAPGKPGEELAKKGDDGIPGWLIGVGVLAAIAGLVYWRIKAASEPPRTGLRG
jgi:chromosome segregation ATPase